MKLIVDKLGLQINGIDILTDISFEIQNNSFTCIIGANGAGKSSILKIMTNQLKNYSGSIPNLDISEIAYLPQNLAAPPFLNVYGVATLGLYNSKVSYKEKNDMTLGLLHFCGVKSIKNKLFTDISSGEKQRTWLAFALAQSKEIIIMDEPFSEIDLLGREKFFSLLKDISQRKTLIIVTHDIEMAIKYSGHIISLKEGCKSFDGLPSDFGTIWSKSYSIFQ